MKTNVHDNIKPYKDCVSWKNKLRRATWIMGSAILFRPFAGPLFRHWRNFILTIWGAKMGRNCIVNAKAIIYQPWKMHLGDFVAIDEHVRVYNCDVIEIGTKSVISQNAILCSASHDYTNVENPLITAPINIGSRCWIAADVFVGMGVSIGEGAVAGARACVFKDVDPWTVVGGNPAKFIKKRELKP